MQSRQHVALVRVFIVTFRARNVSMSVISVYNCNISISLREIFSCTADATLITNIMVIGVLG